MADDDSEPTRGAILGTEYKRLSDQEIKDLALGVYRNEIFTSLQIREVERERMLAMVFPIIMFLDAKLQKFVLFNNITHLYAPMASAAPRSINGYPIFFETKFLNDEDTTRFVDKYNEILEVLK